MPPCLTLSNIRYISRVKWSNPGKRVAPFPTPGSSSYWKGSLLVALDYGDQLYFLLTVANFQNNGKIWISCVHKALLSDERKNTVQAKQWLDKCYLDSAPLETTVKRWYADFKCNHIDTNDAECSGCPNLAVVPENTKKLQTRFGRMLIEVKQDSRKVEDIRRQCIHHFLWTFVNEKAVFKVGAAFAHSQSKTTMHCLQQKGVFG